MSRGPKSSSQRGKRRVRVSQHVVSSTVAERQAYWSAKNAGKYVMVKGRMVRAKHAQRRNAKRAAREAFASHRA